MKSLRTMIAVGSLVAVWGGLNVFGRGDRLDHTVGLFMFIAGACFLAAGLAGHAVLTELNNRRP
jgi:hypothetical protein